MIVKERLASALTEALRQAQETGDLAGGGLPQIRLDVPPSPELGDFSSDVALGLARGSGRTAAQIAGTLAARLETGTGLLDRVEVSNAGFLNFHLRSGWLEETLHEARTRRSDFGKNDDLGQGRSVQVEFVSAYPTAPLNVLHGRGAALGDALANVLEWNGYQVTREFYVNDAGSRFDRFARSVDAEYLKALGQADVRPPVDGFQGEYLTEIVQEIRDEVGDRYLDSPAGERARALGELGLAKMIERQKQTLARLGVQFDEWRSGEPTYLAGDLAYHLDKFRRGFERVIDVWGSDHETYARRTLAGIEALGYPRECLDILVLEPVTLKIDGQLVEAGAAGGNNILLDEVIDEVGKDTARFSYLQRGARAPLEFDLDLARQQPEASPAHRVRAALAGVRAVLEASRCRGQLPPQEADGGVSTENGNQRLLRRLADFPDEVRAAARELDPSRLTRYATELAGQVVPVAEEVPDPARLAVLDAAEVVLTNTLTILGISTD
ncbi:MAG: Arginyl-tRNA synthetase [Armatimonadetes bacterium]|nr:Arginyl-tRNA synthetase [Armatimonadota bacterium]